MCGRPDRAHPEPRLWLCGWPGCTAVAMSPECLGLSGMPEVQAFVQSNLRWICAVCDAAFARQAREGIASADDVTAYAQLVRDVVAPFWVRQETRDMVEEMRRML